MTLLYYVPPDVQIETWPWQLGYALTLPGRLANGQRGIIIRVRSREVWASRRIRRHELCHAAQIRRLGARRYLWEQLRARWPLRRGWLWARDRDIEAEAYRAEEEATYGD